MKKLIIRTIITLLWLGTLYLTYEGVTIYRDEVLRQEVKPLPSIKQIQERIGCEKIDGRLCDQWYDPNHSETQAKWDGAINDQYAAKWDSWYEEKK